MLASMRGPMHRPSMCLIFICWYEVLLYMYLRAHAFMHAFMLPILRPLSAQVHEEALFRCHSSFGTVSSSFRSFSWCLPLAPFSSLYTGHRSTVHPCRWHRHSKSLLQLVFAAWPVSSLYTGHCSLHEPISVFVTDLLVSSA